MSIFGNGGMLTGAEIEKQIKKGDIVIDPYDKSCINPNSYNLKLHPQLLIYERKSNNDNNIEYIEKTNFIDGSTKNYSNSIHDKIYPLDMKCDNKTVELEIPECGYILKPGIIYLGRTVERTFSDKFIPMINGRSSGGRLGISIHICAGFGDIGFDGTWTLEITAIEPVIIYPYVEIAQVCYFKPYGKINKLYNGRYMHQSDATASKFYKLKEIF